MQKRTKIITGVLSAALLVGGVAIANSYHVINITAPLTTTQSPVQQETPTNGTLTLAATETMPSGTFTGLLIDGEANGSGKLVYPQGEDCVATWVGMFKDNVWVGMGIVTYRFNNGTPDNVKDLDTDKIQPYIERAPVKAPAIEIRPADGYYHPGEVRTPGITIQGITFHEGFRAPGLKAVDVWVIARSTNNENDIKQGRDEIVEITGSTGKKYPMLNTKRTGVNGSANFTDFQEREITQYQDISVNEKSITSIVFRRDGKLITIKPDKNTTIKTTHK